MQSNSFVLNLWRGMDNRIRKILNNPNKKAGLNWFKIKQLKHISSGKIREYVYKKKVIYYESPPDFLHGLKEIFIDEIYNVSLSSSPYIIDCGANIGLSIIYLKEKYNDAHILAFEPDKKNYQLLQKNVTSFNLENVIIEEKAVWILDTELRFKNEGNMGSRIDVNSESDSTSVKAVRLKSLLHRKVDFLKIDIEGTEYAVLNDIKESLFTVENMFLEYHGSFKQNNELIEIFQIINQAGFKFYIKEATSVYDHPFLYAAIKSKRDYDVQLNIFCFRS
jgi:FkbM family methyltransferase